MSRTTKLLFIALLAGACTACSTARDPGKGFRLAGNGDPVRGKAAFQEFGCHNCHEVQGSNLPAPKIQTVRLGGPVTIQPSDGFLVTAIINPEYHAARYPIPAEPGSKPPVMPEFTARMTVQQLTDIVAYLQSRFTLRPVSGTSEFP